MANASFKQILPIPASWHVYLNRRMLICVFLGFSSGLPLFVLFNLVLAWLRSEHINLETIGLFALIQFPYTGKFIWAPLMDRFALRLPGWRTAGRRRSWMLVTQVLTMLSIATIGFISPQKAIWTVALCATLLAFFSASQDIVIDAYRRELLDNNEQGLGTAIHINAYKAAGLIPGAFSLILADHLSWPIVFIATSVFMLPGIVNTLLISEPAVYGSPPKTMQQAVTLPFREFIQRSGWRSALLVVIFILLYRLGDTLATTLATPFYLDLGFSKTQIGLIAKNSAFWASIAGGLLGGIWLIKIGVSRGLWFFGAAQWLTIFGFTWLAYHGRSESGLALVIAAEAFATGLSTTAITAYIANTTDPRYTATQFALFTSLAAIPRTFAAASVGYLVQWLHWPHFFLLCAVLAIPGMLLLPKVAPWRRGG
jgi:PAT family beta-lactamase induction signal transducer AmpG